MFLRKVVSSVIILLSLVLLVFASPSSVYAADYPTSPDPDPVRLRGVDTIPSVIFLPEEVSWSLDISRVPTSKPIPLLVGTYWNCLTNDEGFETCDITLVVCTREQDFCTQVP